MTSAVLTAANLTPGRRRLPRMIGVFVAFCLAIAGLTAQPAQAADTGSITGKVFTKAVGGSQTAVSSGFVYLHRAPTADGTYQQVMSSEAETTAFRFTGGTFSLGGLPAGFYKFEVWAGGDSYQGEFYGGVVERDDATAVSVGTGNVPVEDIVLEPSALITGRVTDNDGNPLRNASVMFKHSAMAGGSPVQTDENGNYSSAAMRGGGLVGGVYRVTASHGDYSTPDGIRHEDEYWENAATYAAAKPVTANPGATVGNIDFTLAVAPRVRLTVKDPAGNPMPDATVGIRMFFDGAWGPFLAGPNTTDADGVFRRTLRIGDRYKYYIAQPAGGVKWYGNTYAEATATEISATAHGQILDLTIQLDPAPAAPAPVVAKVLKAKKVSIKGTAKVGKKLRASTSAWGPSPVRKSYKWYRNGRAISGQKKSTYKVRKADVGKRITVRVTQKKTGYTSASKLSAKTSKVKKK